MEMSFMLSFNKLQTCELLISIYVSEEAHGLKVETVNILHIEKVDDAIL